MSGIGTDIPDRGYEFSDAQLRIKARFASLTRPE